MPEAEPEIGTPVSLQLRKWDGTPHRQLTTTYLGSDAYGRWVGYTSLLAVNESNVASPTVRRHVMLIPHVGLFLAHFNEPPSRNSIYADITTTPEFGHGDDGWVVATVDMDLDVVRTIDGRSWIEDQDEFAEHTSSLGYPADLVASSSAAATRLLAAVRAEAEPFASTWTRWIEQLIV